MLMAQIVLVPDGVLNVCTLNFKGVHVVHYLEKFERGYRKVTRMRHRRWAEVGWLARRGVAWRLAGRPPLTVGFCCLETGEFNVSWFLFFSFHTSTISSPPSIPPVCALVHFVPPFLCHFPSELSPSRTTTTSWQTQWHCEHFPASTKINYIEQPIMNNGNGAAGASGTGPSARYIFAFFFFTGFLVLLIGNKKEYIYIYIGVCVCDHIFTAIFMD
jgi:hypothetical protein